MSNLVLATADLHCELSNFGFMSSQAAHPIGGWMARMWWSDSTPVIVVARWTGENPARFLMITPPVYGLRGGLVDSEGLQGYWRRLYKVKTVLKEVRRISSFARATPWLTPLAQSVRVNHGVYAALEALGRRCTSIELETFQWGRGSPVEVVKQLDAGLVIRQEGDTVLIAVGDRTRWVDRRELRPLWCFTPLRQEVETMEAWRP